MKTEFKNILKLLIVCFFTLFSMQFITTLVFEKITHEPLILFSSEYLKTHSNVTNESFKAAHENFSAPPIAKLLDIALQGVVLFGVAVLIEKQKKYQKKYWASALLLTQLAHNFANSNLGFTPSLVVYLLTVFAALIIGLCAIYLSGKLFAKPTEFSS